MATQNVKDFNAVNSVNLINDSFLSVQNGELVRLNGSNVNISGINEITSKNINVTGSFSSVNRPLINGTGVLLQGELDLSVYATVTNLATTGSTLSDKINTLSGNSVLTNGEQTIFGTKYFSNAVYISDLYVTGTEFIANVENKFIESPYILLNLTGGAIDGGLFFVTGSGLTGVNDYGPIIGFDHSNKFKFGVARRSDDLSILNDIAAVQDISNYSGFAQNIYATQANLEQTGSNLSTRIDSTGTNLQSQITGLDNRYIRIANYPQVSGFTSLSVINGDFNNLSGLTSQGNGWFNGLPFGWQGSPTTFAIFNNDGNYIANLGTLGTGTGSNSFRQNVGKLPIDSNVILNFKFSEDFGDSTVESTIFDSKFNVLNFEQYIAPGEYSLTGFNIPANTDIIISFRRLLGNPVLDNVSITQSTPATTFLLPNTLPKNNLNLPSGALWADPLAGDALKIATSNNLNAPSIQNTADI